jgi:hypothetical protein
MPSASAATAASTPEPWKPGSRARVVGRASGAAVVVVSSVAAVPLPLTQAPPPGTAVCHVGSSPPSTSGPGPVAPVVRSTQWYWKSSLTL